jgi:UDP-N-acetylglucosamine acyltransferase
VNARIHAWASVHASAELADDVEVGPFCVVGPGVSLGEGTTLLNNCTVLGRTRMGRGNLVFPYAVIGGGPQVKGIDPGEGRLEIGDDNVFREYVTVNVGVQSYRGVTDVGSRGLFMACSHIAHDCGVGDDVVLGNLVLLGGHIIVEDGANICGGSAAHQYTVFGRLTYVGGMSRIVHDIPPFMKAEGSPAKVRAVNEVGLRRRGLEQGHIDALWKAYRLLWRSDLPRSEAMALLENDGAAVDEVRELLAFLRRSEQGRHGRARDGQPTPPQLDA